MDQYELRSIVDRMLGILGDGLAPFVDRVFAETAPGVPWTDILRAVDEQSGKRFGRYSERDPQLLLRSMTTPIGSYGFVFERWLSRRGKEYAKELREVRNDWAHGEELTVAVVSRALDVAEALLLEAEAGEQADQIADLRPRHTEEPAPEEHPSAKLTITAIPTVSYAMAHCHIGVVGEIAVENLGPERRGCSVDLDIGTADGSLGGPRTMLVDLGANATTTLRAPEPVLDPIKMITVDEQAPGRIQAVLRDPDGRELGRAGVDVEVLAHNQWTWSPPQLGIEMLAAHVQPNSTAVSRLMPEVSDLLREATGNPSLNGYQSGDPARVDAIASAAYEAMRHRDIRYSEPPASWGQGQKVRTPEEVLEGRLGTCLDTTLTLAAVLEQLGIRSTLWLLPGHVFLGYWRTERTLDSAATADVLPVVNLVEVGDIGLIETTLMTGGEDLSRSFAEAAAAARTRHLTSVDKIVAVADIAAARMSEILPLPSRSASADGTTIVTHYTPPDRGMPGDYVPIDGRPGQPRESVPPRVSGWKNSLLDLSLRNKLINYSERAGFRIDLPDGMLGTLEDFVNAGRSLTLLPSDQVAAVDRARGVRFGRELSEGTLEQLFRDKNSVYVDVTGNSYTPKLRLLANKARTIVEETGSNNLYLAFGMLRWRLNDRDLRSPLVLVPVSLSTSSRGQVYRLTMDDAGASTPNFCLLEKLRVSFGLEIPGLADPVEDQSGIDLDLAFDAVRRAIDTAGLQFRVENTVELSILQFAKFPLWRDLDTSWLALAENPLVKHLIDSPLRPFADPVAVDGTVDLDTLSGLVPTPADSSQLDAVAAAVGGQTFVLQGPPGTGKSQTITNLLARALQTGRRVLFVAEKRAALDVVRTRLNEIGLGELSLDLHDKAARPAAVRAQIRTALDLQDAFDADLLRTSEETMSAGRRTLANYAARLHETNAAGLSLYSALNRSLAADKAVPTLQVPESMVAGASDEDFTRIRDCLRFLPELADLAHPAPDHPWGFLNEPDPTRFDTAAVHGAAQQFDQALAALHGLGVAIEQIARHQTPGQLRHWARVSAAPRFNVAELDAVARPGESAQLRQVDALVAELQGALPAWLSTVDPLIVDRDVRSLHQAAVAADQSGFFGRKKRRRSVLDQFADFLRADANSFDLRQLSALLGGIVETQNRVAGLRQAVQQLPVSLVEPGWNPLLVDHAQALRTQVASIGAAVGLLTTANDSGRSAELRRWYETTARGAAVQELDALARTRQHLDEVTDNASARCPDWLAGTDFVTRWWSSRSRRRLDTDTTLVRWTAMARHIEILRRVGLPDARNALLVGSVSADDATLAFDRGIAVSSIAERREASGLSHFDASAHGRAVQRFASSGKQVRAELRRAIPAAVLGRRRFDATDERGQIGALKRQLDRQRGGMSVRKLLDNYGELITQILPCTLMSPESVARFFPPRPGLFDIVVFDEASQIRVADAVGAMGRARSAVVVGDSRQMPPTSFAEVSVSAEEDEELTAEHVADEESILNECVQSQVPSKWLSWHYRSQDEALIAFSNANYYDNRLSSFPAPLDGSKPDRDHGISLIRVDGHFERAGKGSTLRTNPVEARAILDDIRRRFDTDPGDSPSIGVITFNAQQRNLIENLLRDSGDERIVRALDEKDGLFVKNLENVQGDERDVILFSVAFSANDRGVVPLNFGPLSRPGGERRLNVAITRARRQVVLYASFDPADLRAEQTTQIGTKHLKAYLELAADGTIAMNGDARRQPIVDRHRDQIAARLRDTGMVTMVDVGLSEFRVDIALADAAEPNRPLVAVLLDGPNWRARRTVADRDGLPVDVLKGLMRWPAVERIWLPDWMSDQDRIVSRIRETLANAKRGLSPYPEDGSAKFSPNGAAAGKPTVVNPPVTAVSVTTRSVATPGSLPLKSGSTTATVAPADRRPSADRVQPYREWRSHYVGSVDVLDNIQMPRAASKVREVIQEVIAVEGPVHPDRLARVVAAAFGLQRVTEDRKRAIQRLVPTGTAPKDGEGFYWPTGTEPDEWWICRTPSGQLVRSLDQVPLIEIANAMAVEAERAAGMSADEIKRAALNLLGGRRITAVVGERLDAALKVAVATQRIRQVGERFQPGLEGK